MGGPLHFVDVAIKLIFFYKNTNNTKKVFMSTGAETTILSVVTAIGAVSTPIIVLILSAVGWKYRQSIERRIKMDEVMRDDRISVYNDILDPFIMLLMTEEAWQRDKKNKNIDKDKLAVDRMLSIEYRRYSFKLSLVGSDGVVLAFNNLMQYVYNMSEIENAKPYDLMILLGSLLLEIRKSMGNDATVIDSWGMLDWFITDARKIKNEYLQS
ncbi:hypothetical protein [Pseudodesulfovibrio indicus]|uniref:Uncharacterized protein n=2 Tax=Pseudodesulfovibrio indicus TaxID=1716143 RepID=A0AA94PPM3_9BACT|nr:hypothetical protein [Pseudodesulfovibrio indicus]TDT90657.1 hypothetical protein EDC59_10287 [Pseudodesulfovibrio indicus]